MILHLIVSSAILLLAIVASAAIPRLTARTRHAILLAGMASLLLPSTLIARAIERSGTKMLTPIRLLATPVLSATPAPPAHASVPWLTIAIVLWLGIAMLVFLRSLLITQRLVANALRTGGAPPQRTVDALAAARERLSLHTSIDLIASPLCEAPAVLRILRPIIVLPSDGCQSLGDDELESLLCHECAHVARRDNLVGLFEAIAGAVFWFNPLVWVARRRIASAREEACDERVTDAAMPAETYVGALAKLCRSLVAPRVAAVSCMANAHLKERIDHLMHYDTLRGNAFSHRLITSVSAVAVVTLILTGGVLAAQPGNAADDEPYKLNFSVAHVDDVLVVHATIVETKTRKSVSDASVTAKLGTPTSWETTRENRRWRVEIDADKSGAGTVTLIAWHADVEVQRTKSTFPAQPPVPQSGRKRFNGEPISLNLKNADIRDVLKTFGQIADLEMVMGPEVQGLVTADFKDVPWDEALDEILRGHGYNYQVVDRQVRIFR